MIIRQGRGEKMYGTVDAIAQLSTPPASNHGTVTTLTAINEKLAVKLETSQAYTKKLKEEITYLHAKIKPAWQG
jgi:hypothetical protein